MNYVDKTKEKKEQKNVRQIGITVEDDKNPVIGLNGDFTYPEIMAVADYLYQDALRNWIMVNNQRITQIETYLNEKSGKK